ncbi:MAG: nucleoside monophosphate kinase [Planctomycetota bacterium]
MKYKAILLIGPTGAGKTPLGKYLQKHGLGGKRCFHFDFGANLRDILTTKSTKDTKNNEVKFSKNEVGFIRIMLESGALLEDKDFPLARKILKSFIAGNGVTDKDIIVLNGLPRHIGQAKALGKFIRMELVVNLTAAPEIIHGRIRTNAGGDRAERIDDDLKSIRKKIKIFNMRTVPLVVFYQKLGAEVCDISIGLTTKAKMVYKHLNHFYTFK